MTTIAQPKTIPQSSEGGHVSINLSGPPDEVYRLLQGLAGTLPQIATIREPDQLFLTRPLAALRSGIAEDRLSYFIRAGKLTNHGTARRMLFSLAEIKALADSTD